MLNRLYIVVGVLAILILAAAFVVPSFIPWGSYRGRMESLAAEALGAEVRVNGDIHFALLPQPHMVLTDISVGPQAQPVMSVKSADADFSLIDFLRNRYTMTRLVLDHPVFNLTIEPDGTLDTGLKPAGADSKTALSVDDARVDVGAVQLTDTRSGRVYTLDGLTGALSVGAIAGPFGFEGGGSFGDQHYYFHITTGAVDATGNTHLSLFAKPDSGAFSISTEGALATLGPPHFSGDLTYRQSPAVAKNASGVVGDLTLTSKVDATPARLVLSAYTLIPDENRAVTRLTGAATLTFGATTAFSATIESNVLAMPPRDATTETGPQPYELVRMLGELPVLPVPPLPGTIAADVSELDLRSFALHNVTLLATTDAKQWTVKDFSGQLPGNTNVELAGDLTSPDGRPAFAGTLSIASDRLDQLATLWRKPAPGNPLFNLPGRFGSQVSLLGQTMALTNGQLTLGGETHLLTALINFGKDRRIDLSGQFKDLSAADSAALVALVPDLQKDTSAGLTFPEGAVSLSADSATLLGLSGHQLDVEGKWAGGTVELSKFSAGDLGGAGLDLSLALSGSLAEPRVAGDGQITMAAGGGPALDVVYDALGTPVAVRSLLSRSLPVSLKAHLDDPTANGGQGLSLSGKAGTADVTLVTQLDGGLLKALAAPISATLDVESADPRALTAQLGLGDVSLLPESGPVKINVSLAGPPSGALKTSVSITDTTDSASFEGAVTPGDLSEITGTGKLKLALSDTTALAADAGLAGLYTPPVTASADLSFDTGRSLGLDNLAGTSGPTGFSGSLALNGQQRGANVTGELALDSVDVAGLVAATGGAPALLKSDGKLWPDGPLSAGDAPRATLGSIDVKVPVVTLGSQPLLTDAGFTFSWDATNVGVHKFAGKLGGGTLALDVGVCCAGPGTDKQVTGEGSLSGVPLDALLPPDLASTLSGTLDGSARFNGSGDSVEAVLASLSGDGSFALSKPAVQNFDPGVFAKVAAISDIVNLDPADLNTRVANGLDGAQFAVPSIEGGFTIAGGVVRVPNIAAQTPAAKLFGGLTVKLADLGLGGSFALTPVGTLDQAGLVSATTSTITANLSGTLLAPSRSLDVAGMVNAIKMKALEVEVTRLETLKAADDQRQMEATLASKEATEDEQAAQLAQQQAADAAKAAAFQASLDAAAKKAAQAAAAARATVQPTTPAPLDLGMPQPGQFQ